MPFQSEKQRRYLWANEPEIARDWSDKYGSRVKKVNGGIMDKIMPYVYPEAHAEKHATRGQWAKDTPQYHRDITENYFDELSKNWSQLPYVGKPAAAAIELFAPGATGIMNLPYDTYSAFKKFYEDPEKYADPGKWSKINAYFPDLADTNVAGILSALDREDMFSAAGNRFIGATRPLAKRMQKGWDAIKNEFSGRVDAAEMPRQINRFGKTIGPLANTVTQDDEEGGKYYFEDGEKYITVEEAVKRNKDEEDNPYDFTDRLRRRGDFTTKYPSYNPWQMRGAQAPGLRRNVGRMMDFLRGPGTRLTPAQQRANQSYMTQQRITRDPQTGRMLTGPFAGQNAPGTSYFGSQTFPQMAQKWALKNQHRQYTTPKMQKRKQDIMNIATGGRDPNQGNTVTGFGKSGMGRDPSDRMARGGLASLWPR
jgi:hypothetical protein